MRILHAVEFYSPSTGGMQEVVRQLSERMAAIGHEVTVVTSKIADRKTQLLKNVRIKEFAITGNEAKGIKGEYDSYQKFLKEEKFDVVTFFAAQQWTFDAAIPILNKITAKKVFVPTGFSGLYDQLYKDYYNKMPDLLRVFDSIIFLSEEYRDINFARKFSIENTIVIPNGADADEFVIMKGENIRTSLSIPTNDFLILHIGSYTGIKGHKEAIKLFFKSRLKNATLLMVGNNLSYLRKKLWRIIGLNSYLKYLFSVKKKLRIIDMNRADTVSALQSADLFLFPSLIECSPLVLFEACASGTPFLTSDCGNAKEIIEWTKGGLLLPTEVGDDGYSRIDIKASAKMLEDVISNNQLLTDLSKNGFESWKKRFTWEKISNEYLKLYQEILSH